MPDSCCAIHKIGFRRDKTRLVPNVHYVQSNQIKVLPKLKLWQDFAVIGKLQGIELRVDTSPAKDVKFLFHPDTTTYDTLDTGVSDCKSQKNIILSGLLVH